MNRRGQLGIVGIAIIASLSIGAEALADTAQWEVYTYYTVGDVVSYEGSEYEALQAHTALPGWEPPNVLALWEKLPGDTMDWEVQVYYAVGDGKVDSNETCQIKLWDSHVGNIEDEGDFFILMP